MARSERLQVLLSPAVMRSLKKLAGELGMPAGTLGAQIIGEYLREKINLKG